MRFQNDNFRVVGEERGHTPHLKKKKTQKMPLIKEEERFLVELSDRFNDNDNDNEDPLMLKVVKPLQLQMDKPTRTYAILGKSKPRFIEEAVMRLTLIYEDINYKGTLGCARTNNSLTVDSYYELLQDPREQFKLVCRYATKYKLFDKRLDNLVATKTYRVIDAVPLMKEYMQYFTKVHIDKENTKIETLEIIDPEKKKFENLKSIFHVTVEKKGTFWAIRFLESEFLSLHKC